MSSSLSLSLSFSHVWVVDHHQFKHITLIVIQIFPKCRVCDVSGEHFHISSTAHKQHFSYWTAVTDKITVLCALFSVGSVEPIFFNRVSVTVTVTSDTYGEMLENFWKKEKCLKNLIFYFILANTLLKF